MAQRKKKRGLVSVLIDKFMRNTLDPNRQTLANSIGNPIKEQAKPTGSSENEIGLRSDYLYATVFPGHVLCGEHCEGHTLLKVPALVLEKLTENYHLPSFNPRKAVC